MRVTRPDATSFIVAFESEQELRDEHRDNLSVGGLRLPTEDAIALQSTLRVTLLGPWGGTTEVSATVVAPLPDGVALAVEGDADEILRSLLAGKPTPEPESASFEADAEAGDTSEKQQNTWDRIRGLTQMEKLLLAAKADRSERALLVQDNDPRVLLSLLRNPRLTVDEVRRVAKSSFLNFQIADVILKNGQWMGSLDVRVALIHNPRTPPAFALRILPMLPDSEVRTIARHGTSMQLKQAALRQLQKMG